MEAVLKTETNFIPVRNHWIENTVLDFTDEGMFCTLILGSGGGYSETTSLPEYPWGKNKPNQTKP